MENNLEKEFGEHLKSLRISRNLSQVQLAFKGEFDRNYIGMLERGERNPSLKNLKRLNIGIWRILFVGFSGNGVKIIALALAV